MKSTLIQSAKKRFDNIFEPGTIVATARIAMKQVLENEITLAIDSYKKELRERVLGTEEYIAVKDNDTHRYQIPRSKKNEWYEFCEIPSDDERSWDVPEWAEQIDGMPVKSFKDSVLSIIDEE